jgi:hypothetical protein
LASFGNTGLHLHPRTVDVAEVTPDQADFRVVPHFSPDIHSVTPDRIVEGGCDDRLLESRSVRLIRPETGKIRAEELGHSKDRNGCPDIWRLANGDVAVIGTDLTDAYASRLPEGVPIGAHERLVVIPGSMLSAAKQDIPDV